MEAGMKAEIEAGIEAGIDAGMEVGMGMDAKRMADLERRVLALEERTRRTLWREEPPSCRAEELAERYGEYVDKTVAARILGVTRTTVYAMLADGRIEGACEGRRVSVSSIAQYMKKPKLGEGGRGRRGKRRIPQPEAALQA